MHAGHQHRPLMRENRSAPELSAAGGLLVRFNSSKRRKVSFERRQSELAPVPSINVVQQVAPNVRRFGESFRTLFRWKDSVYRLLWRHMLTYYILYVSITLLYNFVLEEDQKRMFRQVAKYVKTHQSSFNLMIMLGFFTSAALHRLFNTQTTMPGTAKVISTFVFSLKPDLPEGKYVVKRFSRWAVLSWLLAFRLICKPLRTLYPDMMALQREGLITEWERIVLERTKTEDDKTPRPLTVIDWMLLLLKDSMQHDRYFHKSGHSKCIEAVMAFKKSCGNTIKLATRNIPHAVIQAVIISVYFFGLITMLARDMSYDEMPQSCRYSDELSLGEQGARLPQNNATIGSNEEFVFVNRVFSYFPLIPGMQFFIFFSWLTFGRAAVNPFGDDYTDINIEQLLESHIQTSERISKLYTRSLENQLQDWKPLQPSCETASTSSKSPKEKKELGDVQISLD